MTAHDQRPALGHSTRTSRQKRPDWPVPEVSRPGHWRRWTAIHRGQVRVVAARPLPTGGLTQHDVAALREQARAVICSARRDLVTNMPA